MALATGRLLSNGNVVASVTLVARSRTASNTAASDSSVTLEVPAGWSPEPELYSLELDTGETLKVMTAGWFSVGQRRILFTVAG